MEIKVGKQGRGQGPTGATFGTMQNYGSTPNITYVSRSLNQNLNNKMSTNK